MSCSSYSMLPHKHSGPHTQATAHTLQAASSVMPCCPVLLSPLHPALLAPPSTATTTVLLDCSGSSLYCWCSRYGSRHTQHTQSCTSYRLANSTATLLCSSCLAAHAHCPACVTFRRIMQGGSWNHIPLQASLFGVQGVCVCAHASNIVFRHREPKCLFFPANFWKNEQNVGGVQRQRLLT